VLVKPALNYGFNRLTIIYKCIRDVQMRTHLRMDLQAFFEHLQTVTKTNLCLVLDLDLRMRMSH